MTEDEMVGWHHWLKGHEFEQAPGGGEAEGSLVCCSPWDRKESDKTEQLNNKQLKSVRCMHDPPSPHTLDCSCDCRLSTRKQIDSRWTPRITQVGKAGVTEPEPPGCQAKVCPLPSTCFPCASSWGGEATTVKLPF